MPRDITDRAVFAGIDYAKQFFFVTIGDKKGQVLEQVKVNCDESLVIEYFGRFSDSGMICAIESCRGHEWLVEVLRTMGFTVHLANARLVKKIVKNACKTDRIDSRILMELLAKNFLPTCYWPTEREQGYRELIRGRSQLVRTVVRLKQRVHALLDKENKGFRYPFSLKGRERLDKVVLTEPRDSIMREHLELIDLLEERIHEADKELKQLGRYNPDVWRLKKMPGFDYLSAMAFVSEIGDVERFRNADQVAAYLGLVPRVYASGNVKRSGRITKEGSKYMRRLLVQCAWASIKASPNLRDAFNNISRRRGKKIAIVAIARKLATIGYWLIKEKRDFDESKLDAGLERAAS